MTTARLHLVRHGRAAAGWGEDPDPGLDDVGRAQATAIVEELAGLGPLSILTSPLRRARETAAPLAARWGSEAVVEPAVGEIPSPTADLADRSAWLRDAIRGSWMDAGPAVVEWRSALLARVLAIPTDTVVFTHFVAINTIVAAAAGDDRLIVFTPTNCSRTVVDIEGGNLSVVQLGGQADTDIA